MKSRVETASTTPILTVIVKIKDENLTRSFICLVLMIVSGCVFWETETGFLTEINHVADPVKAPPVAIMGVRLIDGLGGSPVEDAVVIVTGKQIAKVGSSDYVEIPSDAERFDGNGMTEMPGLIDSHFHSIMDNDLLYKYLRNGITTVRDPGHPFRYYQSLHFSEEPVPRVFLTGAHLDGFPPVFSQQAKVVRDNRHVYQIIRKYVNEGLERKLFFWVILRCMFKVLTLLYSGIINLQVLII